MADFFVFSSAPSANSTAQHLPNLRALPLKSEMLTNICRRRVYEGKPSANSTAQHLPSLRALPLKSEMLTNICRRRKKCASNGSTFAPQ
jgi:hypothetical protein